MRPVNARAVLVLVALTLLGAGAIARAQDEQGDAAQALLKEGVTQYKAKQFSKSQATLLQVKREKLTEAERKELDGYLNNVRGAIRKQAEAMEAYEAGQKALKANDLAKAEDLFGSVAKNDFAPDQLRKDAEMNRILASRKAQASKAAGVSTVPAAAVEVKPVPTAAAEPATPTPATPWTQAVAELLAPETPVTTAPATPAAETPAATVTPAPAESAEPAKLPSAVDVVPAPAVPTPVVVPTPAVPAEAGAPTILPAAEEVPAPAVELPPVAVPTTPAPAAEMPSTPAPAAVSPPGSTPAPVLSAEAQARIAKAKALMAEGDKALDAQDVDKAISLYEQAVNIAPEYDMARVGLERARAMTGQSAGLGAISKLEQMRKIRKEETDLRYAQSMQRAREAIQSPKSSEDFTRALDEVGLAQMMINTNKSLYSDAEYRAKTVETDQLRQFVETERSRWEEHRVAEQRSQLSQRESERKTQASRQQKEKIDALKDRVRALRKEQKYSQAVDVLGQILRLDPNDPWAAEWLDELKTRVLLMEDKQAAQDGLEQEARQLVDVRQSQIPWYQLIMYPQDWQEITRKRQAFGAEDQTETEADRAVHRSLQRIQKKLELPGVPLSQAIDFIRDISGASIHVQWTTLEQAGVTGTTSVNVKLQDVTIEKALRTILEDVGSVNPLGFVISDGVITISTKEDLSKHTLTQVYDIRDLIVRIPNFVAPQMDLSASSNSGGGTSGSGSGSSGSSSSSGGSLFGNASGGSGNAGGANMVSREDLVKSILDLVETTIAPETWIDKQGTIGSIRELNGSIIVTQTSENHRELVKLLGQLRESKALQINVEARFIEVSTGFLNRIGVDVDFFFNIGSSLKPTGLTDPLTGAHIVNPSPGAALPQWNGQGDPNNRFTAIPVTNDTFTFTNPTPTGVPNGISPAAVGNGLQIAGTFLDDIQVDFLVNASQANQTTRTLTAPRVTIFNGQHAYVIVSRQQAYVATVEPVVVENVAAFRPIVATVQTGSVLDVEGTISADRRYVTLTMLPSVSVVNGFTEYRGTTDAQGNAVAGSGQLQLPNVTVQQVACTVSVPDGGTLLLGGQKLAGEVEREAGVPIISKIPVLNRLTTNKSMVRDEQTLLILVRPKILIQHEYEEAAFPP